MKRKAPASREDPSKRRKQDSVDISDDSAQVQSIHAELSALKTREIADISQSIASLPHMTFGKRPIKLKPKSTTATATTTATAKPTTTSTITATKPSNKPGSPTPLSDTTLKAKHHQLESAKAASRRSSFGQRGKRAKGSFEQGESVMPHESVPSDKLFRHIDADLPEPHRARHLLIWCARRAAAPVPSSTTQDNPKGKGKKKAVGTLNDADSAIVALVQEKVVRQLMDLSIDIPLYDIGRGPFSKGEGRKEELADDPVNARNRELKERLTKSEERARDEDAMWSKIIQDYNSLQSTVLSTLPEPILLPSTSSSGSTKSRRASQHGDKSRSVQQILDVRLSELDEKWRLIDDELELYRRECERGSEMDRQLAKRCKMLPLQLDSLRQSLARSTAFTEQAKEFIDNLFKSIDAQAHPPFLHAKQGAPSRNNDDGTSGKPLSGLLSALSLGPAGSGGTGVPGGDSADLFRALSRLDMENQGGGGGDGGGWNGSAGVGGVVTAVQPATPRRMPGTPRKGGGDNGGGGGSALRRG